MTDTRHFLIETYHGPMLLSEDESSWTVTSPCGLPETYPGRIPAECLVHARQVRPEDAKRLARLGMQPLGEGSGAAA
jgi:hypothetical protein